MFLTEKMGPPGEQAHMLPGWRALGEQVCKSACIVSELNCEIYRSSGFLNWNMGCVELNIHVGKDQSVS